MMRITGAQLRVQRERLGFSRSQLATILGITPGVIADWEDGRDKAPLNLDAKIALINRRTDDYLDALITTCANGDKIITYRTDDIYRQHQPDGPYTASWHRALCARLLEVYPEITIEFID
ncbi:helix-turn-helix domain-containing protein [Mycobacterium talmoniae]|uniref:HTH cro/C1-type domain-containing protein n=1 Tax=Mycobacterium talmoniae TaxID=1858794 RepID=A0A1S1NL64_9MYCO|nr:helix-turn-helix domain-containing protein [Mycobacterium talmoniae]OHV03526.1 hypothetical protein BKN37_14480 [Mycobacterium talmoniae]